MHRRSARSFSRFAFFVLLIAAASSRAEAQGIPTPGPDLAYFRFNEGVGSVSANLALGAALPPAAVNGATPWVTTSPILGASAFRPGTAPTDVAFTNVPFALSGAFTIEFWMRGTSPVGTATATSPYLPEGVVLGDPTARGFEIRMIRTGSVVASGIGLSPLYRLSMWINGVDVGGASMSNFFGVNGLLPAQNTWFHVAFVRNFPSSFSVDLYVNGVPYFSTTPVAAFTNVTGTRASGLSIGGNGVSAPLVAGEIDEVRVWSSARTQAQLVASMNAEIESFRADHLSAAFPLSPLNVNAAAGTFNYSGVISGWQAGTSYASYDPNLDPIAGATATFSGLHSGQDFVYLADAAIANGVLTITSAAGDSLTLTAPFSAAAPVGAVQFSLGGPLGTTVLGSTTTLGAGTPRTVVRTGSGSRVLDALAADLSAGSPFGVMLNCGANGRFVTGFDRALPATPQPVFQAATDGQGGFQMIAANMPPGAVLLHLFAIGPTIPLGTGPLFGLELNPSVFAQIQVPIGTAPFKVLADARGLYAFGVGPGALPPGLTVDCIEFVGLQNATALTYVSPVKRIVF